MKDPLERMISDLVVLDTGTPIVYIGRLTEVHERMLVLEEVDMHDCRDGHATQEAYIAEVYRGGVEVNRRRVAVMRSVIISVSRLDDVVAD